VGVSDDFRDHGAEKARSGPTPHRFITTPGRRLDLLDTFVTGEILINRTSTSLAAATKGGEPRGVADTLFASALPNMLQEKDECVDPLTEAEPEWE